MSYSKTCVEGHSQKDHNLVFKTNYRLMQVKSIAECSKESILQYFWPSSSYHLSFKSLFCLFLSGHFTQVLLYLLLVIRPCEISGFFVQSKIKIENSSDFPRPYLIILFQCAVDHIAVDSDEARKCLNEGQFLFCF